MFKPAPFRYGLPAWRADSNPRCLVSKLPCYATRALQLAIVRACFLLCAFLTLASTLCANDLDAPKATAADLEKLFKNPPPSARPWVLWYWLYGRVSPEGITADLEAMKASGLGGAFIVPLYNVTTDTVFKNPATQLSPRYWEMLRHAFKEADRLGLNLSIHNCDGFATSGGPWITPDLAMQKVVWSTSESEGGKPITLSLPQPPTVAGYYQDIATFAFPTLLGTGVSSRITRPTVTTTATGSDPTPLLDGKASFRSRTACTITFAFDKPFTARTVVITPSLRNFESNTLGVEASDDGKEFRAITTMVPPRHGWQDNDAPYSHSIPPTTARYFRFTYNGTKSGYTGAEDMDTAKWNNGLRISGIELLSDPRIHQYEAKSAQVWRIADRTTSEQVPNSDCVPLKSVINLTGKVDNDGTLHWDAPAGHWTIVRMGHTATGHTNETGGAGKGLECDKFNPAAARLQYDKWFGESLRQIGPELAHRVCKFFYIDSWEGGSQNWSPMFADEFKKRRGYDPIPYLLTYAGIPIDSADTSEGFLFDVRTTIAELVNDGFFKTMAGLAHKEGMEFTAESVAPTMPSDGMLHFGTVDVPMGEFWLRSPTHDKPNDIQDAISAAHVYGKNIVQAEAFTELRLRWDEYPGMMKALGDHNFALGINRFVFHVMVENPWLDRKPGMTLGGVGTFMQRDQTWWPLAKGYMDYIARCQALLQQGHPVAQVAYFTGEEVPRRSILPERLNPPLPPGYKADSINRDALLRLAEVRDSKIVLPGGAAYSVLVLPESRFMTIELLSKLKQFAEAGAAIYGPPPQHLAGLMGSSEEFNHLVLGIWGEKNPAEGWEHKLGKGMIVYPASPSQSTLDIFLKSLALEPNPVMLDPNTDMEYIHRTLPDGEVFFISNQSASENNYLMGLKIDSKYCIDRFNPVDGSILAMPGGVTNYGGKIAASKSYFIVAHPKHAASAQMFEDDDSVSSSLIVSTPWKIQFDPTYEGPAEPITINTLTDWTKSPTPAVRDYSGIATYSNTFNFSPSLNLGTRALYNLNIDDVKNIATVKLNGVDCGTLWTPPYRVDITKALKPGENKLEIRVANTWANRIRADQLLPEMDRFIWTNARADISRTPPLPAGLIGIVTITGTH